MLNTSASTPSSSVKSNTPSSGRSTPTSAMPTLGVVNPNFSSNNTAERSASASPLLFNSNSSTSTTPNLPTFNVNRSSSSILRQVLQEEDAS